MKTIFIIVGLLILALFLSGCTPLSGVELDDRKPEGEVQIELSDRDKSDSAQTEQDKDSTGDFMCELYPLLNNEVLFKLTNNSETAIQELTMYANFHNEQGNLITYYETYFKGVAAGQELYAFSTHLKNYEVKFDEYRIKYKAEYDSPDGLYDYSSAKKDIEIEGEAKEGSNYTIVATLVNTGQDSIDYVNAFMLFYHENEIVGASERFAQNIAPGGSAELSFMPSVDTVGRMIPYDSYEVIISQAYYKK